MFEQAQFANIDLLRPTRACDVTLAAQSKSDDGRALSLARAMLDEITGRISGRSPPIERSTVMGSGPCRADWGPGRQRRRASALRRTAAMRSMFQPACRWGERA